MNFDEVVEKFKGFWISKRMKKIYALHNYSFTCALLKKDVNVAKEFGEKVVEFRLNVPKMDEYSEFDYYVCKKLNGINVMLNLMFVSDIMTVLGINREAIIALTEKTYWLITFDNIDATFVIAPAIGDCPKKTIVFDVEVGEWVKIY